MRQRLLGADHDEVGRVHGSLGSLLSRRGQFDEAQRHFDEMSRIAAARGDPRAALNARCMLAAFRLAQHDFAGAKDLATKNCAEAEALGLLPVLRLTYDHNLATALLGLGDYGPAIPILRSALLASTDRDREWSRLTFALRSSLARALWRNGEPAEATALLLDNLARFHGRMDRLLPALLERERLAEVARNRKDLELLLECSARHPGVATAADIYGALLAWKGQVARGMLRQQEIARQDPEGIARLRRLQQIASLASMGRADAAILREKERLETAIARSQPASESQRVAPDALAAALPDDAAIVDFVLYREEDGAARFVAFIVRNKALSRVELGPAAPIAVAVEKHVLMTSRSVRAGAAALSLQAAADAHRLVMAPLTAALGDSKTVWISPDDVLATLPFETLPGTALGSYLVETLAIRYLQDGLDLLRSKPTAATEPRLLAFGSIDYGGEGVVVAALRGERRPFPALPQTERELREIVQAVGAPRCDVLRGRAATEANLRTRVSGATFVHLATHGFCGEAVAVGAITAGIALASANEAAGDDDGILTVEEAGLLDLQSCQLVVLSACQTGLGKPFAGESLLGLRRALRIAGAAATMTSLWRVDDTATAELMADFYRETFTAGQAPARALRRAQLLAIARARAATGEGLPGLWGGFVHEGGN